ncbi:MAG: endolytic transglycosylase MltG [Clostridia bacterium]|nr:endolytic transglycosylase MltG [Clostridia bacterium]
MKKINLKSPETRELLKKAWVVGRPVVVLCCALLITFMIIGIILSTVQNKFLAPVDKNDATPIEFIISDGWGASTIAKHLYEACGEGEPGLIRNKAVFKVYVDFMGKSKDLQAGKYYLSKNMDIPTIIDTLCDGGESTKSVKITIPEGTTIENIVRIMNEGGLNLDEEEFLGLCKTGENFTNYEFVNNVYIADEDRQYALEGYLFPDTYDLYKDASSETVINKMLSRFKDVCYSGEDSLYAKAKAAGLSMDEAIALASVIEKEAVTDADFLRVSAVFHNRMDIGMKLQSDAPLAYIYKRAGENLKFTAEELQIDSPYNTYVYEGVPIGAICNPGKRAIEAAVSPDSDFVAEGYLFFCLKDKKTGENVYAKTYEEHQKNVEMYEGNWGE